MTISYGFFGGAVGSEPEYLAADFADRFAMFFSNGVKAGTLAVSAGSGRDVNVAAGFANHSGYHIKNDAVLNLAIAANTSGLSRIDRIVAHWDLSTPANTTIKVIQGTPASTPAAPPLTNTSSIGQLSLAQVLVVNGATTVTVNDERGNPAVCGFIDKLNGDIIIGTDAPADDDGRPDGTVYLRYS